MLTVGVALLLVVGCAVVLGQVTDPAATAGDDATAEIRNGASTAPEAVDPTARILAGGAPIRWSRCGPIDVLLREGAGPPDAAATVESALAQLSEATGLTFRLVGTTRGVVSLDDIPDRTVAIAWGTVDEVPALDGTVVGVARTQTEIRDGGPPLVTRGRVVVEADAGLSPGFEGAASDGAVLLHELGHVVGLDHVDDPSLIMNDYADPSGPARFQPEELDRLATVAVDVACDPE